ncbi:hypothetical protein BCV72DRAFT_127959 [Rhizopus microsporus var. microsporus]|uniref:Mediator complex subunit 15 KIX domain-containing protein n=2 Tax=Rhizopus microsporus TaxID=58291 RepID=A0A2G4T4D9_RHIZD|nr:uncharacterized protein RHIMIDRAFT_234889 [Rhizopus microsporus ATCC 52813]ORE06126.1 hypothetical protein BCV72DRAFT_127959 [Rhizopus microsporus var. microsporus]PHZ15546.1 hypothetical protein RHIMIDRAFT_234889 [Rhizopus microsporus ATCC 52813]
MNGQIPHVATSLDINNGQEGQSNLLLEDNTSNINWRDELSVADRTQFIAQLSLALKRLSPNTSDTETRGVASSFEAGLYQRCNSKNEYIMAHAKKFQQIKDQIASNSQQVNFLQQPAFNSNQSFGSQSFVYNRPRPVLSQQQFQFYFARQMALQQQQQQQQQYLQQQYSPNMTSYEPLVSTPSLTPSSTASSSVNTIVANGMNRLDQQQMYAFNPNLMRPVQQQGMINPEFMMQNRPFPQKQQPDVMLQRPPMKYPAATGVTPTKMSPAAIVKQLDETVRKTKAVTGAFIENLSGQDKAVIREQIQQMKAMYDKLDHLLPIFLSRTGNYEATRRIILMKHMLEDQVNLLPQDKYIINLDNVYKLRDQLNGYFTWIRNTMGMGHPLQMQQQQQQQQQQHNQQQQQQQQYIQQLTQQQLTQHQLSQQQLTQQQLTQQQLLQSHLLLQQQQLQLLSQSQLMQPHLTQSQLPQPPQLPQEQPQTQPQQQQHHQQMLQQLMDDKLIQSSQPQSQQPSSLLPSYMGQQQINNSSNTMVPMPETSVAPSTSPMTMKRNSIDLKLPPSKKQRGAKSSTSSPVMNRKNDSAPSLVQSQLPNSQNQMQQQHQQQQPIIPTGIPVKEGMPLNQHEMQLQAFYMAAVEAGIPKDIINLLPPKALQCNWLLQQAAQGRIPLLPQQQQQIQYTLDAYIGNAKATLNMKKEAIPSSKTDTSTTATLVNDSLDAKQFGSYLKEGYKDETFGTPDLGNLTELTSAMKQQEDEAATTAIKPTDEDNFHTWVETDLDIGLDWDANEFVKFDDNESEKLIDDSGKLCAV